MSYAESLAEDLAEQQRRYHEQSKALEDKYEEARSGRMKAEQELDELTSGNMTLKSSEKKLQVRSSVKSVLENREKGYFWKIERKGTYFHLTALQLMLEDAEKARGAAALEVQELKKDKYELQEVGSKAQVQCDAALSKLDAAQV